MRKVFRVFSWVGVVVLLGCEKEEQPVLSVENQLLSFSFKADNNLFLNRDIDGEVDVQSAEVEVFITEGALSGDLTELVASFQVSENATVRIEGRLQVSGETVNDFTDPVRYRVIAENGDEVVYTVRVVNIAEYKNSVVAFKFPTSLNPGLFREPSVRIDTLNRTIRFHNPQLDETSLIPEFLLPEGANLVLEGNVLQSGVTELDLTNNLSLVLIDQLGGSEGWTVQMTREIVDIEDFLRVCPLEDPNIALILDEFEFRVNGKILNEFPCIEPYYIMDRPSDEYLDNEYHKQTALLQALRFWYYLDYDDPYIVPWAQDRLYDWVVSKIDGINLVDGLEVGGYCCDEFDGKTFIVLPNNQLDNSSYFISEDLYTGFKRLGFSIILHESRHVDGFLHSSCCGIENGCDPELDLNNPSAYGIQVWWHQMQYEGIYDFDACSLVKDGRAAYGDRIQLSGIFDPNIWSNRFCSGTYTYEFPEEVLRACEE